MFRFLHNKLPAYNHFRTFGCIFPINLLPTQKFNQKARRCIIICYSLGHKGYKFMILQIIDFFYSLDVFHEHIFSFNSNPQENQHDVAVLPLPHTIEELITTNTTNPQADDQSLYSPALSHLLVHDSNEFVPDHDTIISVPVSPPTTHFFYRIKQPSCCVEDEGHQVFTGLSFSNQSTLQ